MMFWSPAHGQLFEDWVLLWLVGCSSVTFFLLHHLVEVEDGLGEAEEMRDEASALRRSTRLERTYRETQLSIDSDNSRPAMHAAIFGFNRQLTIHRRRLVRSRICAYVALLLFLPLLVEMIVLAPWQGQALLSVWLFYGSLSYQSIFAVFAGHYANLIWEDFLACGLYLPGPSLPRRAWKHSVTLLTYQLRHWLFLFLLAAGARMQFPGLGLLALLCEVPLVPVLYRESWMASNRPAVWLLEDATMAWRMALLGLFSIRLPLAVLLVMTGIHLELLEEPLSLELRLGFHVPAGLLLLGGLLQLLLLRLEYQSDRIWQQQARSYGWPKVPLQRGTEQEEALEKSGGSGLFDRIFPKSKKRNSAGYKRGSMHAAVVVEETDKTQALPVCTLHQLPEVPQEKNVGVMQTVCVLSTPITSPA